MGISSWFIWGVWSDGWGENWATRTPLIWWVTMGPQRIEEFPVRSWECYQCYLSNCRLAVSTEGDVWCSQSEIQWKWEIYRCFSKGSSWNPSKCPMKQEMATPRFSPCGFCFLGESHPQMWNISILDPKKMHRYNTEPGFLDGYWMLRVIQYSGKTSRNVRGAGLMLIWVYFKGVWLQSHPLFILNTHIKWVLYMRKS